MTGSAFAAAALPSDTYYSTSRTYLYVSFSSRTAMISGSVRGMKMDWGTMGFRLRRDLQDWSMYESDVVG